MPTLGTWAGRSKFSYTGSVGQGTKIIYGNNYPLSVSAFQYTNLLNHFRNKTIDIGTSRTNPPCGSVGEWLLRNVTKTGIASYVGPILISEGYARKIGKTQIHIF